MPACEELRAHPDKADDRLRAGLQLGTPGGIPLGSWTAEAAPGGSHRIAVQGKALARAASEVQGTIICTGSQAWFRD